MHVINCHRPTFQDAAYDIDKAIQLTFEEVLIQKDQQAQPIDKQKQHKMKSMAPTACMCHQHSAVSQNENGNTPQLPRKLSIIKGAKADHVLQ